MAKLTDAERENFIGLLEAMGQGNGARAAKHVLAFSTEQTCTGADAEGFTQAMTEVCLSFLFAIDSLQAAGKYIVGPFLNHKRRTHPHS